MSDAAPTTGPTSPPEPPDSQPLPPADLPGPSGEGGGGGMHTNALVLGALAAVCISGGAYAVRSAGMASGSKASAEAAANLEAPNLEAPETTEDTEAMSPIDLDASINAMFASLGDHQWDRIAESIRTEPSAQMPY